MTARRDARMVAMLGVTGAAYVEPAQALDRGLATGRLIEEAERLIRTIEDHRKKAVRELPIAPLLAAVARMKEME